MRYLILCITTSFSFCLFQTAIAQNFGIGTTTPFDKLTVQTDPHNFGITHTDNIIKLSTFVGGGAGGAWIGTQSDHPFHIYTNNGTPQVSFNTNYSTDFKGTAPMLRLLDGSTTSGTFKADGNHLEIAARTGNFTQGNLILQADALTGATAGKMGVGTRNPVDKLTVYTPNGSYGINHTDDVITVATWVGNEGGYFGTKSNHPLRFYTASGPTQMTILTNGNVGIGTVAPTYKLSVNGNIRSKEVVVESGWADYVFDEKYQLPSLDKVEAFIKANKHLPGIPPAKTIQENGLNIGEMQTKMMAKIEELTLYMIEVNRQFQNSQNEIAELKRKLASLENKK